MKDLFFVILLAFIFLELMVVFPQKVDHKDSEETSQIAQTLSDQSPAQKMRGVHLVESREGRQDWELFADSAEGSQGQSPWQLQKVKVLFFKAGSIEFTVTGDQGSIDSKTKDLHIKGHVKTVSKNGYTLLTELIEYSARSREIKSPAAVKLDGPRDSYGDGIKVSGTGMLAQVDQGLIFMQKEIQAKKMIQDKKMFSIMAERAEFSNKSREARFFGNVRMNYDSKDLYGAEAFFEYGAKKDLFDYVKVNGGVRAVEGKRIATSKNLVLNLLEKKFTFSGRPKLIQDGDELMGEEIIFLDGGKKVKVDKGALKGDKVQE